MQLVELVEETAKNMVEALQRTDSFDIDDPECREEAVRRIELHLYRLVIRAGDRA